MGSVVPVDEGPVVSVDDNLEVRKFRFQLQQEVFDTLTPYKENKLSLKKIKLKII